MINKNIILKYLKANKTTNINIIQNKNEIVIKGSKIDLIELADCILSVALSENNKDHIHIDDLTLLNKNSKINNLIIEKE